MPDNRKVQKNVVSTSSNASADNVEEAMRRLKIQTHDSGTYPNRPGEPDCIYYLRTGLCGYGSNCRFNHPPSSGQAAQYRDELPERVGQPECQYFLKTGTCRFGATCKYHHPRDRHDIGQVPLNILGLPMRQEEKSCQFYMRNGSCKFGPACKFHHPQPLGAALPLTGPNVYGSTGSSVAPPSGLPVPAWSLPRAPYISGPRMQGPHSYMPVVVSPQGIVPTHQGWHTYNGAMNSMSSPNILGSSHVYNSMNRGEMGSSRQAHLWPTSIPHFPERPDQPECQYYMKTGSCKFGPSCKYHHPKERIAPLAPTTLGPFELPLRPGHAICTFYSLYGICKLGSSCQFDHPLAGFYNYGMSMPALSIPEPHQFPYQRNSPMTHSSETSPSKSSKLHDQNGKSEPKITKPQNPDVKVINGNDSSQEAPPSTQTSSPTSMEPPHNQSDD